MVKNSWVAKAWILLFPPVDADDRAASRSVYERFAIPYTFKPRLSLAEALVAATTAFLRILLGCLLFAVCGAYALFAWSTIHNVLFRVAAVLALTVSFVTSLVLLMLAGAVLTKVLSPKRR